MFFLLKLSITKTTFFCKEKSNSVYGRKLRILKRPPSSRICLLEKLSCFFFLVSISLFLLFKVFIISLVRHELSLQACPPLCVIFFLLLLFYFYVFFFFGWTRIIYCFYLCFSFFFFFNVISTTLLGIIKLLIVRL